MRTHMGPRGTHFHVYSSNRHAAARPQLLYYNRTTQHQTLMKHHQLSNNAQNPRCTLWPSPVLCFHSTHTHTCAYNQRGNPPLITGLSSTSLASHWQTMRLPGLQGITTATMHNPMPFITPLHKPATKCWALLFGVQAGAWRQHGAKAGKPRPGPQLCDLSLPPAQAAAVRTSHQQQPTREGR